MGRWPSSTSRQSLFTIFLEPPATTGPDPCLRRPALPSTSHHRRAWQRPQAIPLIQADLQIGLQSL